MLELVNEARAAGQTCGSLGDQPPAPPLELAPPLTQAAQEHSEHMAATGCFSHDTTGATPCSDATPCERIAGAGYPWSMVGENISFGAATAAEAMQDWLASDLHCRNIMEPGFQHFGAGVAPSPSGRLYFTQTFGATGSGQVGDCR
jgi:uncharacterized protein YkwD